MTAPHPGPPADAGVVLPVPPEVPRAATSPWERRLATWLLRSGGWRMRGTLPDLPKAVFIAAPHSSNWDGLWMYLAATAMGIDVSILGKDVLFRIPVLSAILRRYGGIPAHPHAGGNVLHQLTSMLRNRERCWVGIAPEGTRRHVGRWRIGFWKIASLANVPVVPVYLHYPDKVIGVMPAFHTTGDMAADIARIRASYAPWSGKYHGL